MPFVVPFRLFLIPANKEHQFAQSAKIKKLPFPTTNFNSEVYVDIHNEPISQQYLQ